MTTTAPTLRGILFDKDGTLIDFRATWIPAYHGVADELAGRLGGGAALTREKIVAAVADEFVCIADESKLVKTLGAFPLPVEVIPMARTHVIRQLEKLGGKPRHRRGVITDNGNIIVDIHDFSIRTSSTNLWSVTTRRRSP